MGRFIAFLGAGILILVGLVFIFDLDTKLFTAKTSSDKEIDNTSSELINLGGITLGVKNEIDSVRLSIGGIDGIAFTDETDYGNCYQIRFEPIEDQITPERFDVFQKHLEDKYNIEFNDDSTFRGWVFEEKKVRKLHVLKEPTGFIVYFFSNEDHRPPFILTISDNRLDPPIPKLTYVQPTPKPDTTKISLKGITLGEKNNKTKFQTTVGGINGIVSVHTLKDGTVYSIDFTPEDISGEWKSITENQLRELEIGLENKYEIELLEINDGHGLQHVDYVFFAEKESHVGKVQFIIRVKNLNPSTTDIMIKLDIGSIKLRGRFDEEQQDKINSDF